MTCQQAVFLVIQQCTCCMYQCLCLCLFMHELEPGEIRFLWKSSKRIQHDTQSILYIARDIRSISHTYLAIHEFLSVNFSKLKHLSLQNRQHYSHGSRQFRSYICLCLYLCVSVHELIPQDVLMSTINIANDDDLDV